MLKLGGGTDESHARVQRSVNDLWRFTGELFDSDDVDERMARLGIAPHPGEIRSRWDDLIVATY